MADNLTTPLAPGATIAADDVGGILYPINKLATGPGVEVDESNPLPVSSQDMSDLIHILRSLAHSLGTFSPDASGRLRVTASEAAIPISGTVNTNNVSSGTIGAYTGAVQNSYEQYGMMMQGAMMIRGGIDVI